MIKSELVEKLAAENPHLFQRDIENIVNAILDEIGDAMARGDRVELRVHQHDGGYITPAARVSS